MLDRDSPRILHLCQNVALLALSFICLPVSTVIVLFSFALDFLSPRHGLRKRIRKSRSFHPKTVLITGISTARGLRIARAFYETGHRVIGADFEIDGIPVAGRFSKTLDEFYRLEQCSEEDGATEYIQGLINIALREKVDLWIGCSDVVTAIEDAQAKELLERKTSCKAVQFNVQTTSVLQDKSTFIRQADTMGLPVPETYEVRSRDAVHRVIHGAQGKKKYVMESIENDHSSAPRMVALLPRRTLSETYQYVSDLDVSKSTPWVLQRYISGNRYSTHSLVVNGEVKFFVAFPSAEWLMTYKPLAQDSGLQKAMFNFTQEFASRSGSGFTGHLAFDFIIEEKATERGLEQSILPVECHTRAHTATVLFDGQKGSTDLVRAYLSVLAPTIHEANGYHNGDSAIVETDETSYAMPKAPGYYSVGYDLVSLVLEPSLQLLLAPSNIWEFAKSVIEFMDHVVFWKDVSFDIWDPVPWWWQYHVYWPGQFLKALVMGPKWNRVNVSTMKMIA